MSTEVNIDASELGDAAKSLKTLKKNLSNNEDEFKTEEAGKMRDLITNFVRIKFDNTRTRENQTSLLDAFEVDGRPGNQKITTANSDADHARPLEEGKSPHFIPKPLDSATLKFEPENPSAYVGRNGNNLVGDDGFVVLDKVYWKATGQSATGYGYVNKAQQTWDESKRVTIPRKIRQSIISSGFTPSK
jgi:hypothetical protein